MHIYNVLLYVTVYLKYFWQLLNDCIGLFQILCWCILGGPLPRCLELGCHLNFRCNNYKSLCIFWLILRPSLNISWLTIILFNYKQVICNKSVSWSVITTVPLGTFIKKELANYFHADTKGTQVYPWDVLCSKYLMLQEFLLHIYLCL